MNNYIKYFLYCINGLVDSNLRNNILKIKTSNFIFIRNNGEKNANNILYFLKVNLKYSGWFSMMNHVLSGLVWADNYHMTPIISLGNSQLYSDTGKENENKELYEYFYKQPTGLTIEDINHSKYVVYSEPCHFEYIFTKGRNFDQESKEILKLAEITRKYISLNETTQTYISIKISGLLKNKKTIGVHVRGTDFKKGFNNHAKYVPVDKYVENVKKIMSCGLYEQIFLATDEESTILCFLKEFGDKVVYHDVFRASGTTDVGIHCTNSTREHHKYTLGLEVLLDMFTLSHCDVLIGCKSGVVFHAIINKVAGNKKYDDICIIDMGTYKSNHKSQKEIQRRVKRNNEISNL